MKGQSINEFIDDLISMGGPEKEFVFRNRFFFLETMYRDEKDMLELYLDEYDNTNPKEKVFVARHSFWGKTNLECVNQFEQAKVFDGLTIYGAEPEIEVLFG